MTMKIPANVTIINGSELTVNITIAIPAPTKAQKNRK